MVAVQHGSHGCDFFGEQTQVEFGIAVLDHAAQQTRCVDAAGRPVDGTAIAADLLLMTGCALVLGQQLLAQVQIGPLEDGRRLGLGCAGKQEEDKLKQNVTHGYKVIQSRGYPQRKS